MKLDPYRFKLLADFEKRFARGRHRCGSAAGSSEGDVAFGAGVVVRGDVRIEGPRRIADGEVLEG